MNHDLTFGEECTIADALVAFALSTSSTDERIAEVISILRKLKYPESAAALERLQTDTHSVKV